jgi:hexosaminidase
MAALSEVVWSPKKDRDWNDFAARVEPMMCRYEAFGCTYARSAYLVNISSGVDSAARRAICALACEMPAVQIRYTLDGSDPTAESPLYTAPLDIDGSATIKAAAFHGADRLGAISTETMVRHLASFIPVKYEFPYEDYTGGGDCALTDGLRGTKWHNDGRWQGFYGVDLVATIDLGEVKALTEIGATFLQSTASWIFVPQSVEYFLSEDGVRFESAASFGNLARDGRLADGPYDYSRTLDNVRARFVQIVARNMGPCPAWHPGKGEPSWIFVDEIVIE